MTKTQAISAMILSKLEAGFTIKEAMDAVCGAGSYEKLASDIWEAAQK